MDSSRLSELKRTAKKVVREAQRPGGSLDNNEFTMGIARRLISEKMDLGDDGLDESKWKKVVKEQVMHYLENDEDGSSQAGPSRSPSPQPVKKPKAKRDKISKTQAAGDEQHGSASPAAVTKADVTPDPEPQVDIKGGKDKDGAESDMSSVYDVPPLKRRKKGEAEPKKKQNEKSQVKEKKRTKRDSDESLSPDEAKVAELKRIVVACGVRKQWSKEFADCPLPKDQIRLLNRILSELGMKGNPTMGKAKSLKEKRELAAELDDVQEFASKRGLGKETRRASRSENKRSGNKDEDDSDENADEDVDEGADAVGPDPKDSALGSIMDFLGDQSD